MDWGYEAPGTGHENVTGLSLTLNLHVMTAAEIKDASRDSWLPPTHWNATCPTFLVLQGEWGPNRDQFRALFRVHRG